MGVPVVAATIAIGAAVGAGILVPFARIIPSWLYGAWRTGAAQSGGDAETLAPGTFVLPLWLKLSVILGSALLTGLCTFSIGPLVDLVAYAVFFLGLLLLVAINIPHSILPNVVTGPLFVGGLLVGALHGVAPASIYGALLAAGAPLILVTVVRTLRGADLLGSGDIKTIGAAGAWVGIGHAPLLLGGFIAGTILVMFLNLAMGLRREGAVATGPAHLLAALIAIFGPRLIEPP